MVALGELCAEDLASAALGVSKATLHTHVGRAYGRLGVHDRAALVALLAGHGFQVTPDRKKK